MLNKILKDKNGSKPQKTFYKEGIRHKIIDDGIAFVNMIASDINAIKAFGDDIIQFFYDISISSNARDRQKPLKFAEAMSHKYLELLNRTGWYGDKEPYGDDILQIICGIYSMDRTGIFTRLRYDLTNIFKEKNHFTLHDLIGWDPRIESPPLNQYDRCKYCRYIPKRGIKTCKCKNNPKALDEMVLLTPFRHLSVALTYSFYITTSGIEIEGLDYNSVFNHVKEFHPYLSREELNHYYNEYYESDDCFKAECYLVTHVLFTCNNWCELRLRKNMFPHEYSFLIKYTDTVIEMNDVHLAGEFLECLYSFGLSDEEVVIRKLIDYIISHQNKDGSFSSKQDEDAYSQYHATMTCCQGLTHHKYRGFGPGIVSVLPLIKEQIERDTLRIKDRYEMYFNNNREVVCDSRYNDLLMLFGDNDKIKIPDIKEIEEKIKLEKEEIRKEKLLNKKKKESEKKKKRKENEESDEIEEENEENENNVNENNKKEKRKLNENDENDLSSEDERITIHKRIKKIEVDDEIEKNNNNNNNKENEMEEEEEEVKENNELNKKPVFYIKTNIPSSFTMNKENEISPNSPFHQSRNSLNTSINDNNNNKSPPDIFKEIIKKEEEIKVQNNDNNNENNNSDIEKKKNEEKDGDDELFKMFEVEYQSDYIQYLSETKIKNIPETKFPVYGSTTSNYFGDYSEDEDGENESKDNESKKNEDDNDEDVRSVQIIDNNITVGDKRKNSISQAATDVMEEDGGDKGDESRKDCDNNRSVNIYNEKSIIDKRKGESNNEKKKDDVDEDINDIQENNQINKQSNRMEIEIETDAETEIESESSQSQQERQIEDNNDETRRSTPTMSELEKDNKENEMEMEIEKVSDKDEEKEKKENEKENEEERIRKEILERIERAKRKISETQKQNPLSPNNYTKPQLKQLKPKTIKLNNVNNESSTKPCVTFTERDLKIINDLQKISTIGNTIERDVNPITSEKDDDVVNQPLTAIQNKEIENTINPIISPLKILKGMNKEEITVGNKKNELEKGNTEVINENNTCNSNSNDINPVKRPFNEEIIDISDDSEEESDDDDISLVSSPAKRYKTS